MRNVIVSILALCPLAAAQEAGGEVNVYVSLDEEHSRPVLALFEQETGIKVNARYDTEATKTVGLARALLTEKDDPVADVFWNNELAKTIELKKHGVLQKYEVASAATIPAAFKDPEGYWVGFAARARILIVNTDLVTKPDYPTSMWDLTKEKWRGRVCMAKPETGTTAAHASALYTLDVARADEYFDKLIANDCTWLTGNAHCMREVSAGRFAFGWTDTDDYYVAKLQGKPVAAVYPDKGADEIGVLYIPNSLVLIKGAKHREQGLKLIDWLLRPQTEEMLAKSATAQIPVRPAVPVPDHVRRPDQIGKAMEVDWNRVGADWEKWVGHVRAKFAAASAAEGTSTLVWIVGVVVVIAAAVVIFLRKSTTAPA